MYLIYAKVAEIRDILLKNGIYTVRDIIGESLEIEPYILFLSSNHIASNYDNLISVINDILASVGVFATSAKTISYTDIGGIDHMEVWVYFNFKKG